MARRILNRKDLRADYEAAEARRKQGTDDTEDEERDDEEDDEEDNEAEGEAEDEGERGDDEEEEAPKKKKPPAKPKAKPARTRAAKVTRMRVVWGVFNNSNQRIATYDYPKRADADAHAARLTADKKSTHFVQPVKEPIEEKKDA